MKNLTAEARKGGDLLPVHHGGTEARRKPDHRAIGSSGHLESRQLAISNWQLARRVWEILGAALREIFDESAYQRFLERTRSSRSRDSYRKFMQEHEATSPRKPRCC